MMKRSNLLLAAVLFARVLAAQGPSSASSKTALSLCTLDKFAEVRNVSISNDGRYASYEVVEPSTGASVSYLRSLDSGWTMELGGNIPTFSKDGKYLVGRNTHDSLMIMDLASRQAVYIADVSSYKLMDKWIAYQNKNDGALRVLILGQSSPQIVDIVSGFEWDSSGRLVYTRVNDRIESVNLYDVGQNKKSVIWTASNERSNAGNFVFSGGGIAFVTKNGKDRAIWYFNGQAHAQKVLDSDSGLPGLLLNGISYRGFTSDGTKLFIQFAAQAKGKAGPGVDVWSYTDSRLQSEQLADMGEGFYTAVLDLQNKKVTLLEGDGEKIVAAGTECAVVAHLVSGSIYDEWYWNRKAGSSVSIVLFKDGKRKLISEGIPGDVAQSSYRLSPEGRFVVYYDGDARSYFSYEVATGIKRNITRNCKGIWTTYVKRDVPIANYMLLNPSVAGWIEGDKAVLLYDQSDIYEVDLLAKKAPVNLVNYFGKAHHIEFRLAMERGGAYRDNEDVFLSAFNRDTKNDGFYKVTLGQRKDPVLLSSQACMFKGTWEFDGDDPPVSPVKASNAGVYLVRRQRADESPNYFWTADFKTFNRITDIHPERACNWLTTELVTWRLPDGNTCQGILYKPEDFDPGKKYPLIFHYYENVSEGLHEFIRPQMTRGPLNIPYYVSNGYLVFTPDMHYRIGHPGQSVVNTIVSAAECLSRRPYVDARHMGIQGHSRGGWETNYILTHTHLFAAAMSSSGFCDYVALYNGARLLRSGISRQTTYEKVYQRIGTTLWDRPDLYIENSPIFQAAKVTTPVLMMANKVDNDVPFEEGVQLFTALRRLGKRAWMLQYDGQSHLVTSERAMTDLETRMKQFFDVYLKDSACPRWMLYGIPAKDKGVEDGLQLVYEKDARTGRWVKPAEGGLLTEEEKKRAESLEHRRATTVTIQ